MIRFRHSTVLTLFLPFLAVLLLVLALAGCQSGGLESSSKKSESTREHAVPASAAELIRAMHARYSDSWYETLTFEQETIQYRADGADTSMWYEAMIIPGLLRIDIGSPASGDAYIFRNDSLYVFSEGEVVTSRQSLHPLLLLGFDVYRMPPDDVTLRLDSLGFDLNVFSTNQWQGRDVFVVGAESGDESRPQFWIDRERLVFVRMIQTAGQGQASMQEVQFNAYTELAGGWIAPEVDIYFDGTRTMTERYSHIETGVDLPAALFIPATALSAPHWVESRSDSLD